MAARSRGNDSPRGCGWRRECGGVGTGHEFKPPKEKVAKDALPGRVRFLTGTNRKESAVTGRVALRSREVGVEVGGLDPSGKSIARGLRRWFRALGYRTLGGVWRKTGAMRLGRVGRRAFQPRGKSPMTGVSRRQTFKLAAAAALGAANPDSARAVLGQVPAEANKIAGREVGPDPHAKPKPDERHAIVTVRDNLYRYEVGQGSRQHSSLFLVTPEGIILTDPLQTSGALWLRDELKSRFNKPVKYVVYSHAHFDHIGGGQVFQGEGATVIAHANAVEPIIGERLPTAAPDKTFEKSLTLELGGEKVELTHVAPSHSNSMTLIHFPNQRTMMAVDFCPVGTLPFNDFLDFYYDGWMESLRWLERQDFDILEGGHHELGDKKEVAINLDYMQSLHDQVLRLIRAGQSWDQLWRNVKLEKFKDRRGYAEMRVLNIQGMFRWVSNHRRGIW